MHTLAAHVAPRGLTIARHAPRGEQDLEAVVHAAAEGDERAWELLHRRFSALLRSVARRYRLDGPDQDEVTQRTWLRLVEHIDRVREPAALPGWLVTTASRECLRILRASSREVPEGEGLELHEAEPTCPEEAAVAAERRGALHRALDGLPGHQRGLMRLLLDEPSLSYGQVGERLGIPVGSIGPTRGRALSRLRRDPRLVRVAGASSGEVPVAGVAFDGRDVA